MKRLSLLLFTLWAIGYAQTLSPEAVKTLKEELELPDSQASLNIQFNEEKLSGVRTKDAISVVEAQKILKKDPTNLIAQRRLASDLAEKGDTAGGNKILRAILLQTKATYEADPTNVDKLYEVGQAYRSLLDNIGLLQYYQKAAADIDNNSKLCAQVAFSFYFLQDMERAYNYATQAFKLDPTNMGACVVKAMMEYTLVIYKMGQVPEGEPMPDLLKTCDLSFVATMLEANKENIASRTMRETMNLMLIMMQAVLRIADADSVSDDFGKKKITITLSENEAALIERARLHFEGLGAEGHELEEYRMECLMVIYWLQENRAKMEDAFARCIATGKADRKIYQNAVLMYAFWGEANKAAEILTVQMPAQIRTAEDYLIACKLQNMVDNETGARASFAAAQKMNATHPLVVEAEAFWLAQDGNYAAARKLLNQVKQNPSSKKIYQYNDIVLDILLGNKTDARYKIKLAITEDEEKRELLEGWLRDYVD